jgi:serine/threonine protein phosphatase 1
MSAESGIDFEAASGPPGMRLFAIGDVHGRADLLDIMLERIDADLAADRPDDWRIVFLGDYVDRGPDSAGVLETIARRTQDDPRHIALLGNHDQRLDAFLDDVVEWPNFEEFGGRPTALSYGVDFGSGIGSDLVRGHLALGEAVPAAHKRLLKGLKTFASFGDFFFCHAGIRPGIALEAQSPDDLIWIRKLFHDDQRLHPKIIVHGHTPVHAVEIHRNRVNLDTMAFRSGILSALAIDGRVKKTIIVER